MDSGRGGSDLSAQELVLQGEGPEGGGTRHSAQPVWEEPKGSAEQCIRGSRVFKLSFKLTH